MERIVFGYVTCPDAEMANNIAMSLVKEKMVACANIINNMRSIYSFEGEICVDEEVMLILKTVAENQDIIIDRVKELHSYTVPCIVFLGVEGGNYEFLEWVSESVSK